MRHFRVQKYVLTDDKIKEDTKILFLSDLHNCKYGIENVKLVESIKKINPQMILIGGDLINGKAKSDSENCYGNAITFLKGIAEYFPVYYIFGNHELYLEERELYKEYIEKVTSIENVYIINNRSIKTNSVVIHGLKLPNSAYKKGNDTYHFSENDFRKTFGENEADSFEIMLVHKPERFEDYAKSNVDLVLAGHNHGGTIRLPIIRGIVSRDFMLLPKYSYGMYTSKNNNTKMILTGGLGDHTIHFRLFNMPEIVEISLMKGQEK